MAGDVVSAGTFVAAVLEQAGYLTQGEFLVAFKSFFRDAGALVYFIGAVGGLISLVLFGSFRASRYLIFGPAIYWALVGPTVEIEGVVAKLGGGEARGFVGDKGEAQSEQDRDAVLEKSGKDVARQIKVAQGFWLFAHPINDFVNEFVDVMLKDEDSENLMVEHKVRGLELIARSLPQSPEEINILEQELLVHCPRIYHSALGVAQNYIKARSVAGISSSSAPAADKYTEVANDKMKTFLATERGDYIGINSSDTPQLYKLISDKKGEDRTAKAYGNGAPKPIIKCTLAWDIFLEMMWAKAADHMPNILQLTAGAWEGAEGKKKACEYLTSKLYDDAPVTAGGGAACDIQPGVALALLANHLGYMDTFQRVAKRHVNSQDPMNPKAHSSILASSTLMAESINSANQMAMSGTSLGVPVGMIANSMEFKDPNSGKTYSATDWAPAVVMNLIQGVSSTEQVGLPIYLMTQARKELYSRAMHMPYYQGICLYLIAVAYPFLALLVLLPGKASVFLNVPLSWLWIKSWDIGFAAVIILERVMYNLLPNASIAPALRTTEAWDWKLLPIILGEGFNFNHVQNVAQYYTILAMATAGIPVLTGVIILKAKKAILGSFVGAIDNTARDSGQREAGKYSIASSNERSELRSRIEGFSKQQVILGSGGVEGGTRGPLGGVRGLAKVFMNSPGHLGTLLADKKGVGEKIANIVNLSNTAAKQFADEYQKGVSGAANFESEHRGVFDPMFGRWGMMQMHADAYAAALDGAGTRLSGGFETNAQTANLLEAHMTMIRDSVSNVIELERDRAKNIGATVGGALKFDGTVAQNILAGSFAPEFAGLVMQVNSREGPDLNVFSNSFDLVSKNEDGYQNGLGYQRFFGFSAETILESYKQWSSPDSTEEEKLKLHELLNMGGVMGDYFRFQFSQGVQSELSVIPGGASGQPFYGFGGDRTVRELTPEGLGDQINIFGEFDNGGFFNERQARAQKFDYLEIVGIPFDQNKIFLDERITADTALRTQDQGVYVNNFYDIVKFLETTEEFKEKNYSLATPTAGADISGYMTSEVQKLIEIAKDSKTNGDGSKFDLPAEIDQIAQTNPLFAAQIVENYFENLSQAQKAENAGREFKERSGPAAENIFSTADQARRREPSELEEETTDQLRRGS